MDTIQIQEIIEGTLHVVTPFHPEFPARARKLSGKYHRDPPHWLFDRRQEKRVRELCRDIFGSDGTPGEPTVCIRLQCVRAIEQSQMSVFFAGRMIARAFGRDSGVRLGPKVVSVGGEDDHEQVTSGGSQKNWKTLIQPGAELEVYDLPEAALPSAEESERQGWRYQRIPRPSPGE